VPVPMCCTDVRIAGNNPQPEEEKCSAADSGKAWHRTAFVTRRLIVAETAGVSEVQFETIPGRQHRERLNFPDSPYSMRLRRETCSCCGETDYESWHSASATVQPSADCSEYRRSSKNFLRQTYLEVVAEYCCRYEIAWNLQYRVGRL
jgi:hypothetical protein